MNLFYVLILLRIMTINGVMRSEVLILVMKIPKFSLLLISKPVKIIANVENTKIDEENILICVTIAIVLNKKTTWQKCDIYWQEVDKNGSANRTLS